MTATVKQPTTHLQNALLFAMRQGDCAAMQKAHEQGASPHILREGEISAWGIAVLKTPSALLPSVFALLEDWGVARLCYDLPGSHPCLSLTSPFLTFWPIGSHKIGTNGDLAWKIWSYMPLQERQRVLLAMDVRMETGKSDFNTPAAWRPRVVKIWRETPSLEALSTPAFTHYHGVASAILASPLSSEKVYSDQEKACLTQESLLLYLSGFSMSVTCGGLDEVLLAAPKVLVRRCLEKGAPRTLMMNLLEQAALRLTQERDFLSASSHHPSREPSYLAITQQWHVCGARWPEDWPEPLRELLCKMPSIRRHWEQSVLTHTLEERSAPSSPTRPRL